MADTDSNARLEDLGYEAGFMFGEQSDGTITPILVDSDGKVEVDNS